MKQRSVLFFLPLPLPLPVTLFVGAIGGWCFWYFHFPLAWLLGALAATMIPGLMGIPMTGPKHLRDGVLAILGVLLGSGFSPDVVQSFGAWTVSLVCMLLASVFMGLFGVWYGIRIAGYDRATAWFAGIPGGLSVLTALSPSYGADARVVALSHGWRLVSVLVGAPLALHALGVDVRQATQNPTLALGLGWEDALLLLGCAVAGPLIGKVARLPAATLTGPLILSALLHMTGVTDAKPPSLVIILAQIVIGVSVGTRFSGTSLKSLAVILGHAIVMAVGLLLLTVAMTFVASLAIGLPIHQLVLAYVPGGAPEMGLVALSLGIEPAFVATHHLVRVTIIVLMVPWLAKTFARDKRGEE